MRRFVLLSPYAVFLLGCSGILGGSDDKNSKGGSDSAACVLTCEGDSDTDSDSDSDSDSDADSDSDSDSDSDTDSDKDADGDGFSANQDCDDNDADVNPGAQEVCNGIDDDCDDNVDDDDGDVAGDNEFYRDSDGDGYGSTTASSACEAPSGYVSNSEDCDDRDADTHPGAEEICGDGSDNDCDGSESSCGYGDTTLGTTTADAVFIGETASDSAGWALTIPGDINGDGRDDILIGAPNNDHNGTNDGLGYVFYGPVTGSNDLSTADDTVGYAYTGLTFGYSVTGIGDWDADGYDDFVFGSNYSGGVVYLWAGGGTLPSAFDSAASDDDPGTYCGTAIAGGGDITGDGKPDLVVGCYG